MPVLDQIFKTAAPRPAHSQRETADAIPVLTEWKGYEKASFRVAFVFFCIYSIPWDPMASYQLLWNIDYSHFNYRNQTEIVAFFNPQFINIYSESGFFGIASYIKPAFTCIYRPVW